MSEGTATNPREMIGANNPPLSERLAIDYQQISDDAEAIAQRANALPLNLVSDEELGQVGEVVKDARALRVLADNTRREVKQPHLDAGKDIDNFFEVFIGRMRRIQLALESRAGAYQAALAAEARRKAEEEAAAIRKADEERAAAARRAVQEAEAAAAEKRRVAEAEAARGRAGSAAKKAAEAEELARAAAIQADLDRVQSAAAEERAGYAEATAGEQGREAARIRTDAGLVSTATKWKGAIGVWDDIDLNELKPHFSRADVEKAINAYVRLHKNDRPLKGVVIQPETRATFR